MMKKLLYVSFLAGLSFVCTDAQQTDFVASNSKPLENAFALNDTSRTYYFEVYGDIPTAKPAFEEEHYLGGDLTAKWNSFNQNYTQLHELKVGFTNSTVEINKPSIYNAVIKVNNYFKKATRKETVRKEDAIRELRHIFDCANVICFHHNTSDLELAMDRAKTPEEIIRIFNKVTLKIIQ